jgi:hypothetical protein
MAKMSKRNERSEWDLVMGTLGVFILLGVLLWFLLKLL